MTRTVCVRSEQREPNHASYEIGETMGACSSIPHPMLPQLFHQALFFVVLHRAGMEWDRNTGGGSLDVQFLSLDMGGGEIILAFEQRLDDVVGHVCLNVRPCDEYRVHGHRLDRIALAFVSVGRNGKGAQKGVLFGDKSSLVVGDVDDPDTMLGADVHDRRVGDARRNDEGIDTLVLELFHALGEGEVTGLHVIHHIDAVTVGELAEISHCTAARSADADPCPFEIIDTVNLAVPRTTT